jgi:DNA-binding CsgD family transcriptional regulator
MATVLFTDVVDSTPHRARLGESTADRVFREHEDLLRLVVDRHHGRVLKGGGDGVMAVFSAASDAVAAGAAIQREVQRATPDIGIRVGVAAGDVSMDDGDCFGLPVVVAKRLESAAGPGEVYVSAVVRLMAGDRGGVSYRALEPLNLKGLDGPVDAFAVEGPEPDGHAATRPFPGTLRRSEHLFVGRGEEVTALRAAWERAKAGGSELVLIGGEAGAGKSRLTAECARTIHDEGAIVLCGVDDPELSMPYQPWAMALDQLFGQVSPAVIESLRDELATLTVLDPRIGRHAPGLPRAEPLDPEAQRLRILRAIAAVLRAATGADAIALVLDDLHWAGPQTLDVLRYLARTEPVPRLLVVGTFRDNAGEVGERFAAVLSDLRRMDGVTRLKLGGLDLDDVTALLRATRTETLLDADRVAAKIAERTGGNAFLVSELCCHVRMGGGEVPDSIREVVAGRIKELSAEARQLAQVVAVGGGRVTLPVLSAASGLEPAALPTAFEELVASGLIDELAGPPPAYQFAHALLRDAVDATLPVPTRLSLHLALAEAIERIHEADRRGVLVDLVRHFSAAAPIGRADKAIYYGGRAVAMAMRTAAYDEGMAMVDTVLASVPAGGRDRIQLQLARVELAQRAGRTMDVEPSARAAFAEAEELGAADLQATIAVSYERGAGVGGGIRAADSAAMIDAALRALDEGYEGDDAEVLGLRLRAAKGRAMLYTAHPGAQDFADETLAEARSAGDDLALALALGSAMFFQRRDPAENAAIAREVESVTQRLGETWLGSWATSHLVRALIRGGRLGEARVELARLAEVADANRYFVFQFMVSVLTGVLALADGRFERAEAEAEAAEEFGASGPQSDISHSGVYGLLMFTIRREQGRLEEVRPILTMLARVDHQGAWAPGLAFAMAELGMHEESRAAFSGIVARGFDTIPRDTVWPVTLAFLAETAFLLDDVEAAPALAAALDEFAGTALVAGFTTCVGPADRLRAALAATLGDAAQFEADIEAARSFARRSGSPAWEAQVEHTHALGLARLGDAAGAAEHYERACRLADPIGMRSILDSPPPAGDRSRPTATPVIPDGLSPREAEVVALVAFGCSNREIGERLNISANTAANHVRSILTKTGTANRAEAAAYAVRHGLTTPRDAGTGEGER